MIDTDKYEGHTPAPWKAGGYDVQAIKVWTVDGLDETQNWIQVPMADRLLAVDAPLLLAEVKRLREENDLLRSMQRDGIEASAHDNLLSEINRLREENTYLNHMLDGVDKHTLDHVAEQAQIKMHEAGECYDFCIVCETEGDEQ
jgi:U3 small nucleolar ribonucleoprotein component